MYYNETKRKIIILFIYIDSSFIYTIYSRNSSSYFHKVLFTIPTSVIISSYYHQHNHIILSQCYYNIDIINILSSLHHYIIISSYYHQHNHIILSQCYYNIDIIIILPSLYHYIIIEQNHYISCNNCIYKNYHRGNHSKL